MHTGNITYMCTLQTCVLCVNRMVNTCLAEELKEIHAFEQKTITPEQWEKQKSQWHTLYHSLHFKNVDYKTARILLWYAERIQVLSLISCKSALLINAVEYSDGNKTLGYCILSLLVVSDLASQNLITLPRNIGHLFYNCHWIVANRSCHSDKFIFENGFRGNWRKSHNETQLKQSKKWQPCRK